MLLLPDIAARGSRFVAVGGKKLERCGISPEAIL